MLALRRGSKQERHPTSGLPAAALAVQVPDWQIEVSGASCDGEGEPPHDGLMAVWARYCNECEFPRARFRYTHISARPDRLGFVLEAISAVWPKSKRSVVRVWRELLVAYHRFCGSSSCVGAHIRPCHHVLWFAVARTVVRDIEIEVRDSTACVSEVHRETQICPVGKICAVGHHLRTRANRGRI